MLDELPATQIGVALFGAVVAGYDVWLRARAAESLRWPAVRGRMVRSLVREDTNPLPAADETRTRYTPEVRYEYVVDGHEHAATRIDLLDRAASWPGFAERVIARYPMWSEVTVFAAVALALALSAPPSHAQTDSVPPLPAPGRLIDLGGWRLHLHCTGEPRRGQPTVVLEAGAGGFSVDWSLVQPEVSRFARVCSYDRAGAGWSDLGPRPRTLRQIVWELHELLRRGGERPPYVLVGHSYGGTLARQYAFTYRDEVAGIVFDESGHERGTMVLRNGRMIRLVDSATGRPVPEPKTSGPLRVADIPPAIRAQIEQAAQQMVKQAGRSGLPPDAQRMRTWSYGQIKHWASNDNPFEGEELAALLARWSTTPHVFGDMPIVVLSRGRPESADTARERAHERDQAELLTLSRRTRQVIARHSGHGILIEEPAVTIAAIRDVLAATRR